MDFKSYQKEASKYAKYKHDDYLYHAIIEECGEVNGKLAKYIRKNGVTSKQAIEHANDSSNELGVKLRSDLAKELGDVLWGISEIMRINGFCIEFLDSHIEDCDYLDENNYLHESDFVLLSVLCNSFYNTFSVEHNKLVISKLSQCAHLINYTINDIAQLNLSKLSERESRDVIVGEGDDR